MSAESSELIIIALGGNAIAAPGQIGSIEEQFANTRRSLEGVVQCIEKGYNVVITHGNGPQVGVALLRAEMASEKVPVNPLGILVAETEGTMGYMIQQSLMNALQSVNLKKSVITIISQVLVDPDDDAFDKPTKPIGPEYDEWEAIKFRNERNWILIENSHGKYRRVVASPAPLEILEADVIGHLVKSGMVVITAGGGGIPVKKDEEGIIDGVDAVIDKDLASSLLGKEINASILVLATATEGVYLNYDTQGRELLKKLSVENAKKFLEVGHFPPGSMGPKVEAAIDFVENGGDRAIICSVEEIMNAVEGKKGTQITI